jgi:hypothetical protein
MQPARNPQKLFLLDGPIMETAERRLRVVAEMATVLIANNAWHNFDDARLPHVRLHGHRSALLARRRDGCGRIRNPA